MAYTAVVLTEESKQTLIERQVRNVLSNSPGWVVKCHHMTCDMKPAAKSIAADFIGQEVELEVVKYGIMLLGDQCEAGIAAVEVKCVVPSKNQIKHITLYHHESTKPVKSNEITEWVPISEPYTLRGVVQEVA